MRTKNLLATALRNYIYRYGTSVIYVKYIPLDGMSDEMGVVSYDTAHRNITMITVAA